MGLFTDVYKMRIKPPTGTIELLTTPVQKQFVLNISNFDDQLTTKQAKVLWNFGSSAEYLSNNLFEIVQHTFTETGTYNITALVYIGEYFCHIEVPITVSNAPVPEAPWIDVTDSRFWNVYNSGRNGTRNIPVIDNFLGFYNGTWTADAQGRIKLSPVSGQWPNRVGALRITYSGNTPAEIGGVITTYTSSAGATQDNPYNSTITYDFGSEKGVDYNSLDPLYIPAGQDFRDLLILGVPGLVVTYIDYQPVDPIVPIEFAPWYQVYSSGNVLDTINPNGFIDDYHSPSSGAYQFDIPTGYALRSFTKNGVDIINQITQNQNNIWEAPYSFTNRINTRVDFAYDYYTVRFDIAWYTASQGYWNGIEWQTSVPGQIILVPTSGTHANWYAGFRPQKIAINFTGFTTMSLLYVRRSNGNIMQTINNFTSGQELTISGLPYDIGQLDFQDTVSWRNFRITNVKYLD
jgi:hypothetical protein